jgi:hypothetical protein
MQLRHLTLILGTTTVLSLSTLAHAQAASAATPGIDKRQARQEQRIDQGVASGELTQRETVKLERQQAHIDKVEDKAKADGQVTGQERAHVHRMQDRASARIYKNKHDRQHRAD